MPPPPSRLLRWARRISSALPLLALPGPCTSFDDAPPATVAAPTSDASTAPPTYLALPEAARVCALASRCATLRFSLALSLALPLPNTFAGCMHVLSSPVPPTRPGLALHQRILRAVSDARDCQGALDALPVELLYGADPRCPAKAESTCRDATSTVFCDPDAGYGALSRCAITQPDARCNSLVVPDAGTFAVCAKGKCPSSVPDARCEGTVLETCDARGSQLEATFDCAWLGLACGVSTSGSVSCVTPGKDSPCTSVTTTECSGTTLRQCAGTDTGRWSLFPCEEVDATCVPAPGDGQGGSAICLRRDHECSPLDPDMGSCEGSVVTLCIDGRVTAFDCASAGRQCDPTLRSCF